MNCVNFPKDLNTHVTQKQKTSENENEKRIT